MAAWYCKAALYLCEVPRDQIEVRYRRGWNRLLMLPGNFQQPSNALHVLRSEGQVAPQRVAQQFCQVGSHG
jgi:hypothetical protein